MKSIAVLVSGGGTNLQALIDAQKNGVLKSGKINAVISSNENAYALKRAEKESIRTYIVPKKQYKKDEFNSKLLELLEELNCDLIILAGFMCILSKEIITTFENRIINVHPALIPSFCGEGFYGIHVHEAAITKGVKVSGATVHFVNEITDGGAIILQKAIEVKNDDTPETLQKRIMVEAEWKLLPYAAELFCAGKLEVKKNICVIKGEQE